MSQAFGSARVVGGQVRMDVDIEVVAIDKKSVTVRFDGETYTVRKGDTLELHLTCDINPSEAGKR